MNVIKDTVVLSGSMHNMFYAGLKVFVDSGGKTAIVEGGLQKLLKIEHSLNDFRKSMLEVFKSDDFIMKNELKNIDSLLTTLINKKLLYYKLDSFYNDYKELGSILKSNNKTDTIENIEIFKRQMVKSITLVDDIYDDMYIDSFNISKDFNVYCLNMSTGILYTDSIDYDKKLKNIKFIEEVDIDNLIDVSIFEDYLRAYIVVIYPNTKNIKYLIEVNATNETFKKIL